MILYVYAVTAAAVMPEVEGVDRTTRFGSVEAAGVAAVFSSVSEEEFSQDVIDRRSGDLEWLGAIGYRHQDVVAALMKQTNLVPLRAFTLFSSEEALRRYLTENAELLRRILERLDGRQEWTLRIEFEPQRWSEALVGRVESLRTLQNEIAAASAGKAFLLRKKLDDEKKRASRDAEQQVVAEVERRIMEKLAAETVAESRERRDGAFPQINVLIQRDEESRLQELREELGRAYDSEGITLALSGPWPPYTFAHV
ncbi:MAG TPA: GvpL/GvpF family gas vesicle protein [Thermoanaerobaculia bacterium]